MGLLWAVCFMFWSKSAGLSPADRERTRLKFKPAPRWFFISTGLTWLFTVLSAHLNSSSSWLRTMFILLTDGQQVSYGPQP